MAKLFIFLTLLLTVQVRAATAEIFAGKYTFLSGSDEPCPDILITYAAGTVTVSDGKGPWMVFADLNGKPYTSQFEGDTTTDTATFNGVDEIAVTRHHQNSWISESDSKITKKGNGLVLYMHNITLMDSEASCSFVKQ